VGLFHGPRQTVWLAGNQNQVHMIGHKAKANQPYFVELKIQSQQIKIDSTVLIGGQAETCVRFRVG
jgi:hypothetical protein